MLIMIAASATASTARLRQKYTISCTQKSAGHKRQLNGKKSRKKISKEIIVAYVNAVGN